ncbi:MAG: hypothetical protein ABI091_07275 [Ferruginibacter sp.]
MKDKDALTVSEEEIVRNATFGKPLGRIGKTDWYRISDNCICGKRSWDAFNKLLQKELDKISNKCK